VTTYPYDLTRLERRLADIRRYIVPRLSDPDSWSIHLQFAMPPNPAPDAQNLVSRVYASLIGIENTGVT
jgi:hypothetical protein